MTDQDMQAQREKKSILIGCSYPAGGRLTSAYAEIGRYSPTSIDNIEDMRSITLKRNYTLWFMDVNLKNPTLTGVHTIEPALEIKEILINRGLDPRERLFTITGYDDTLKLAKSKGLNCFLKTSQELQAFYQKLKTGQL